MKVRVPGVGVIDFPDSMTEQEIKVILDQFRPKQDDTAQKLLTTLEKNLKKSPVKEVDIRRVEVPAIVPKTEVQTVEVERIVTVPNQPVSWRFEIERDGGQISAIIAEPLNG